MAVAYRTSSAGGGTSSTGNRTSTISAVAGDLLFVIVKWSGNGITTPSCTDDQSGTYTRVLTALNNGSADIMAIFVRDQVVASTATITLAPVVGSGTNTAGEIVTLAYSNSLLFGSAAVRASGKQENQTTGVPTPVLGAAAYTNNPTFIACGSSAASGTLTAVPNASWTERQDAQQSTPSTALEVATRDSGFTGTSAAAVSIVSVLWCSAIVEIYGNVTTSTTLQGRAAVQKTTTKTLNGRAAIQKTTTQTLQGRAAIQKTTPQTLLGRSAIQKSTPQTLQGRAAIQRTTPQTLDGRASISVPNTTQTKTLAGRAAVQKTVPLTLLGRAAIQNTTLQTLLGRSAIQKTTTQTLQGRASINKTVPQTLQGRADIQKSTPQTLQGRAAVQKTTTQTLLGRAAIQKTTTKTLTGAAYILDRVTLDSVTHSSGTAATSATWSHTIVGTSRLLVVTIHAADTGGGTASFTASYNGTGMTELGSTQGASTLSSAVFYTVAPPLGTHSVSIDFGGDACNYVATAISYQAVNQINPIQMSTLVQSTGTGTAISDTVIQTVERSLVLDSAGVYCGSTAVSAVSHGAQLERENLGAGSSPDKMLGMVSEDLGGGDATMAWTLTSSKSWTHKAFEILVYNGLPIQFLVGRAAIQKTTTQTRQGRAAIQKTTTQTLQGRASINKTVPQTLQGRADIQKSTPQTLLGRAAIQKTTLQTLQGRASINKTVPQTLAGRAAVQKSTPQTLQGHAAIQKTVPQTLQGRASINKTTLQTLGGQARIQKTVPQTLQGRAAIQKTVPQTLQGRASINKTVLQTLLGRAAIQKATPQTLLGRAAIQKSTPQTLQGRAWINKTTLQTLQGRAAIQKSTPKTLQGRAAIQKSTPKTLQGVAAVQKTTTKTLDGRASVEKTITRTLDGRAFIAVQGRVYVDLLGRAFIHRLEPADPASTPRRYEFSLRTVALNSVTLDTARTFVVTIRPAIIVTGRL